MRTLYIVAHDTEAGDVIVERYHNQRKAGIGFLLHVAHFSRTDGRRAVFRFNYRSGVAGNEEEAMREIRNFPATDLCRMADIRYIGPWADPRDWRPPET